MTSVPNEPRDNREPVQHGTFYCSGCGRQFRHTYDGRTVCVTSGCPFKTSGHYRDDYDG